VEKPRRFVLIEHSRRRNRAILGSVVMAAYAFTVLLCLHLHDNQSLSKQSTRESAEKVSSHY
jgi:hypothetical protein